MKNPTHDSSNLELVGDSEIVTSVAPQEGGEGVVSQPLVVCDQAIATTSALTDTQKAEFHLESLWETSTHPFEDLPEGTEVSFFHLRLQKQRVGTIIRRKKESPKEIEVIERGGTEWIDFDKAEPLAESEAPNKPSIAEMRSQLLACKTIIELGALTGGKQRAVVSRAYQEMSLEEELKIDTLIAAAYSFPIYKHVDSEHKQAGGALVREIGDSKPNDAVIFVKWLFGPEETKSVYRSNLIEVPAPSASVPDAIRVDDDVIWIQGPRHFEDFAPFKITAIEGDYAKLDMIPFLVALSELRKV
jgi:hypothetical protein